MRISTHDGLTTRRTALKLVTGAGTGLLAACRPTLPSTSPDATSAPGAPLASSGPTIRPASQPTDAQPRGGGTLRVGLTSEPANLDPHLVGGTSVATTWRAFDSLTRYHQQLQPQPMLAERFEVAPDVSQVKLSLRREVLEVPDARTKIVGTGPFALAEWLQGNRLRLVKNASYWVTGRPYLDEITFSFSGEAQTNIVQFEAGALDVIDNPSVREPVRLQKDPRPRFRR